MEEVEEVGEETEDEASCGDPLATPQVSETHPHDRADSLANEVDGSL